MIQGCANATAIVSSTDPEFFRREATEMNGLIQFTKSDDVAIITINNPPVNALSPGVPEGIAEAIDRFEMDDSMVAAVVIGGLLVSTPFTLYVLPILYQWLGSNGSDIAPKLVE